MKRLAAILALALLFAALPCRGECEHLRVLSATLPPLHQPDGAIVAKGYTFDLLELMCKEAGLPFDRSAAQFTSLARGQNQVRSKPGHLLVGLARTKERDHLYYWVGPYITLKLGLIAPKKRALRIRDDEDIKKLSIAVINGSAPVHLLRDIMGVPEESLETVVSGVNQFRMLRAGRVDAAVHTTINAPYLLRSLGEAPSRYEMVHVLENMDLYFVLNPADAERGHKLQLALDKLSSGMCGRSLAVLLRSHLEDAPLDVVE